MMRLHFLPPRAPKAMAVLVPPAIQPVDSVLASSRISSAALGSLPAPPLHQPRPARGSLVTRQPIRDQLAQIR